MAALHCCTVAAAGLFGRRPPLPAPESLPLPVIATVLVLGLCSLLILRYLLRGGKAAGSAKKQETFLMTAPGSAAMHEEALLLDPGSSNGLRLIVVSTRRASLTGDIWPIQCIQ